MYKISFLGYKFVLVFEIDYEIGGQKLGKESPWNKVY